MDKRTIIVFGGTGFIGSNICRMFSKQQDDVLAYSSKDCNLLDQKAVEGILSRMGKDAHVILCSSIGRTTEDSYSAFQKNVAMAHNVASEAHANKVRSLLYLSSTDVYGTPAKELPITESTLPAPDTYYGASKLAAESMIQLAGNNTIPTTCLRLPGIFGPGERNRSIVNLFLKKAATGAPLTLSGGGKILRDYVYVQDLCRIIELTINKAMSGTFNIATGSPISLKELAVATFDAVGTPPQIELDENLDGRSHDLVFDTSNLQAALGDFNFTPLTSALKDCLNSE